MRIGIDARFWGLENTGLGRYLMELVNHLALLDRENEYFLFLRKKYFGLLNLPSNFHQVLAEVSHYSWAEQFRFKKILESQPLDLVHFPHFNFPLLYRGKFVVTIHDLIKHESRGMATTTRRGGLYWLKYAGYLLAVNFAVRRSERIIVPSAWWRRRLSRRFGLPPAKIKVTHEAVGEDFIRLSRLPFSAAQKKKLLAKYEIKPPFLLYAGNLYPHKNVHRLIGVVKEINRRQPLSLVIVCAKSVFWQRFRREVEREGAGKFINLAGFVSDAELVRLYRSAEAFVFPSLLEGFGLPGLEAMAAGVPVVCARASCLPEVYASAAVYFDPVNPADIQKKILSVLGRPSFRRELIRRGKLRFSAFSWEKTARQTLSVYRAAGL